MSKPANYDEQLKYYTDRHDEVYVVSCNKCNTPLAFEVKGGVDGSGDMSHPEGRQVIPISDSKHPQGMALLSWRPRLDGQVGYLCGAMVENPNYEAEVKAIDEAYERTVKFIDEGQASLQADYEAYAKDYPRQLAEYRKAIKKNPDANLYEPHKPMTVEDPQYPDKPEPSAPKMDYCLNDTRIAQAEKYRVPVSQGGGPAPAMLPFEREQLRTEIALSGNKPDVEVNGNVTRIETFNIERVK